MPPWGEIKHAKFLTPNQLAVVGTLEIADIATADIQGTVPIRFLLMQEKGPENSDQGSLILNGQATWDPQTDGNTWSTTDVSMPDGVPLAQLKKSGQDDRNGECRGIAQATLVRNHPDRDPANPGHHPPPLFETITWCVNMEVLAEGVERPEPANP